MSSYIKKPRHKDASSHAAWAVIMEGVAGSRVETHRLRHLINRALKMVENSDQQEHLYQVAGDLILAVPHRLDLLDTLLDRTSYALSIMGQDFLRGRLPFNERSVVQESVEQVDRLQKESSVRVASQWLVRNAK